MKYYKSIFFKCTMKSGICIKKAIMAVLDFMFTFIHMLCDDFL